MGVCNCMLEQPTHCSNLASLELHSSSSLSKLVINIFNKLVSLKLSSSSSLSNLVINLCNKLASLEQPSFPSLSKLEIKACPLLVSFKVAQLPSLATLHLPSVGYDVIQQIKFVGALSLKRSSIEFIDRLISLPKEGLQHFSGLELRLMGVRAEVLRQLMLAFSSLKLLYVWGIDGEISVPEEPLQHVSTLESLYILNCSGLETLLHWMSSLSSLRALSICHCSELTSLSKEIYSLQKLEKLYLSGFQLTDEDRAKIARLPDINLTTDELADLKLREIFYED